MSKQNQPRKFGTAPVFFTAISTILGAVMFLRNLTLILITISILVLVKMQKSTTPMSKTAQLEFVTPLVKTIQVVLS